MNRPFVQVDSVCCFNPQYSRAVFLGILSDKLSDMYRTNCLHFNYEKMCNPRFLFTHLVVNTVYH